MLTCLDEFDPEIRTKLEGGLRKNLKEKDFQELQRKKKKKKRGQRPSAQESKEVVQEREDNPVVLRTPPQDSK